MIGQGMTNAGQESGLSEIPSAAFTERIERNTPVLHILFGLLCLGT